MAGSRRDKHKATKDFIRIWCDKAKLTVERVNWDIASNPGRYCNCFGFAVGRNRWYQPPTVVDGKRQNPTDFWPEQVSAETTIDAFIQAAKTEGFETCQPEWNEQFETIVLYYNEADREFTHAARQKSPDVWESKLGPLSDIEHPLEGVDNIHYGTGRVFMRRPVRGPIIRIESSGQP
jgi:hypothetical protein